MSRRFSFIGVSTSGSSIMRVFPGWRDALELGADVEMQGWDLPVGADDAAYVDVVERLAADPDNLGALVTTHKLGIARAAGDRFDELDADALLLGEVSCIFKRGERLLGSAKDPVTAAGALEAIIAADHFAAGAEALVMGAGGAGTAIAIYLADRRADRPGRIIVTDADPNRLEHLEAIAHQLGCRDRLELIQVPDRVHDALASRLAERSLVVNATGMGKDTPGSPIAGASSLPDGAVAWELNYRGELDFHRQALAEPPGRGLLVADGWGYFIRGWAAVIEDVFERPIGAADLERLSTIAAATRSEQGGTR